MPTLSVNRSVGFHDNALYRQLLRRLLNHSVRFGDGFLRWHLDRLIGLGNDLCFLLRRLCRSLPSRTVVATRWTAAIRPRATTRSLCRWSTALTRSSPFRSRSRARSRSRCLASSRRLASGTSVARCRTVAAICTVENFGARRLAFTGHSTSTKTGIDGSRASRTFASSRLNRRCLASILATATVVANDRGRVDSLALLGSLTVNSASTLSGESLTLDALLDQVTLVLVQLTVGLAFVLGNDVAIARP